MRYLQQAVSSAIRLSHITPKRSIGWQQEHVHDLVADLYPGYQLAVSSISGQHSNRFHNSRILANTVPLGFCCGGFSSTADYVPATKLNLRQAFRALWRVLASGFHSFLSEWLEEVSQLPLAEPFGSNSGRQWNQQPPVSSLARCVTAPIADPFVGLKRRNVRDRMLIRLYLI